MSLDSPSTELVTRYRAGDERAADELFRRYVGRLTVLARSRLSSRIARRVDPEDVVLSAYRSFFLRSRDGRLRLEQSGDLWRILVAITLNKLHRTVAHHRAQRRSVTREEPGEPVVLEAAGMLNPTAPVGADEAVALAELLETFLSELEPQARFILELRLQDYQIQEIASAIGRSERTVRRSLQEIQERLTRHLPDDRTPRRSLRPKAPPSPALDQLAEARETAPTSGADVGPGRLIPEVAPRPLTAAPLIDERDLVIQQHLGSGGIGRVYRAWHKTERKTVAVKILRKALKHDAGAISRFLREAETLGLLRHPGIVALLGVGRFRQGTLFLVMDFIPGRNLADVLADGPLAPAVAAEYVARVAEAVQYAHDWSVIHCDLKPANVMLDVAGKIHVTDFGLAAQLHPGIPPQGAGGTLGFMAPEQLDPAWGAIGPATDVFGLGALLVALLTGEPPCDSKSIAGAIRKVLTGLHLKRLEGSDVPSQLRDVCRRCLAPLPRERFASASEVAQALRA